MKRSSARRAERTATICGFSSNAFDNIRLSIQHVREKFVQSGIGEIVDDDAQEFRGHYCVTVSNRYFTRKELVPHETYEEYGKDVDPFRRLHAQAMFVSEKSPLIRNQDNAVNCLKSRLVVNNEGKKSVLTSNF